LLKQIVVVALDDFVVAVLEFGELESCGFQNRAERCWKEGEDSRVTREWRTLESWREEVEHELSA
jgi:hypothetical protein